MKNIYLVLLLTSLSALMFSSCTKDLKLEPISQVSNASFWKTENDAQGGLYAMYSIIRGQAGANLYILGEARSEVMSRSLSATNGYEYFYDNTLSKTNAGPNWQGFYQVIHDANLILKYVPKITFASQAVKNNLLAQAYTMRAYVYFVMVRTWGDLPLVTEPTESFDAEAVQKVRSPKEEIFKLIKDDIEKAIALFPDYSFPAGRNLWSKPAVNALKADVYLWTGKRLNGGTADFTTVLGALTEAEKGDVSLLPNYADVFDYTKKGNKEILMSFLFKDLESGETIFSGAYMNAGSMINNTDTATKNAIGVFGGSTSWAPSAALRNQYATDDLRKKASIIEVYAYDALGNASYYGSIVRKFDGIISSGVRKFLDDVVIYRYADILLMKAEAKNALGQDPTVEINLIRQRAYGPNFSAHVFVNGTKDENDAAILKERLLELAFEGKRWWDLVRFGKAFEKVPSLQSRAGQDYLLLFPISEGTLSLEPKVTQNPGY